MYLFAIVLIFLSLHHVTADGPDLLDLLNNHNDVTTTLTRKALRNLVLQANDLIENLTQIQNQSASVFKELIKLNQTLATSKQSDLPKTINKNQIGDALSSLVSHNEQVKNAGYKFGGFLDNLKEFQNIFDDPHGVDNAFTSLLTTTLLRSNAKKLEEKYGLSSDFFDGMLSLFQKDTNFKDAVYKLLNPCEKSNCAMLQNGFNRLKNLVKLSDTKSLADVIDQPFLSNLFNGSLHAFNETFNGTSFNFTRLIDIDNNQTHSAAGPTVMDKIVSFFNDPKSALGKLFGSDHPTTSPPTTVKLEKVSKFGSSLADLLNTLFKPSTYTKTDGNNDGKKQSEDYYDVLYGHKSDHNFD